MKILDSADGLGFQIRGFGPSVVHAVGRGKSEQRERKNWAGLQELTYALYPSVFLNLSWITAGAVGTGLDLSQTGNCITHAHTHTHTDI